LAAEGSGARDSEVAAWEVLGLATPVLVAVALVAVALAKVVLVRVASGRVALGNRASASRASASRASDSRASVSREASVASRVEPVGEPFPVSSVARELAVLASFRIISPSLYQEVSVERRCSESVLPRTQALVAEVAPVELVVSVVAWEGWALVVSADWEVSVAGSAETNSDAVHRGKGRGRAKERFAQRSAPTFPRIEQELQISQLNCKRDFHAYRYPSDSRELGYLSRRAMSYFAELWLARRISG